MQLGITIPLQKFLGLKKPPYGEPTDPFFCWELHRIKYLGRSTLVAVNANSCYTLIFAGMKAASWKHIEEIVIDGLVQSLTADGYSPVQIETYLAASGPHTFTKTHGRKPVASLNRMVNDLYWFDYPIDTSQLYQVAPSHKMNGFLCHAAGFIDYGYPREFFASDMERFGITD